MKARINSGHQRHVGPKIASPMKPQVVKVASGFLPLESHEAHGVRAHPKRNLPSGNPSTGTNSGYEWRNALAGIGKRGGRKMY